MNSRIASLIEQSDTKSISYSEFIEAALYDPESGYYSRNQQKIGKEGDFYTSSSIHEVFGAMFAAKFFSIMHEHQLPKRLIEFGAGNGSFSRAVLKEWDRLVKHEKDTLQYIIIEKSGHHRHLITTDHHALTVKVFSSIEEAQKELGELEGIIFSNELIDAFPVDVVTKSGGKLKEIRIARDDAGQLIEVEKSAQAQHATWIDTYHGPLAENQRLEIPVRLQRWQHDIAKWLKRGVLVTVDYGYTIEEWNHPARREGSLRGYRDHQLVRSPLLTPGEMDITSHVHWNGFIEMAQELSLTFVTKLTQREFLLAAGILEKLQNHYDPNPFSEASKQNRAIRSFIMDGGISSSFDVIIQQKGVEQLTAEAFALQSTDLFIR